MLLGVQKETGIFPAPWELMPTDVQTQINLCGGEMNPSNRTLLDCFPILHSVIRKNSKCPKACKSRYKIPPVHTDGADLRQ